MKTPAGAFLCVLLGIAAADATLAQPPLVRIENVRAGETTGQIVVPVDKSQLLRFDVPFHEISVGNRDIAEVQPLTHALIYVLGKKIGTTNLTVTGPGGAVIAVIDVVVSYDIDGLRQRLHELMPEENVNIAAAGDALSLDGVVSSPDRLHRILEVAEHYAPGKVSNLLSIEGSQQVLLLVKFAEVQRSAFDQFGFNEFGLTKGGALPPESVSAPLTGVISGVLNTKGYSLSAKLDALEKNGVVRTLAEPNLVALSGDTANFLAGGEFPIPVAQTTNGTSVPIVTIDYKQFGVSLAFTPTIVGKDLVNLVLKSEVSALDNANAITANGFQIPALKVRRAKTTVELRDGQSFAVAGLLQDDFANGTNQLPFLGDVPVLGALFRSWNYTHQQTDLVMIVTVHVVAPTVARNLATPLDSLALPSPLMQFGTGAVESGGKPKPPEDKDNQGYVLP